MPTQTVWEKTLTGSKKGFDTVWKWTDKLGAPVNNLSNKLGSEAFWPTTMDKESDKAARILKSFCKDGFYEEEMQSVPDGPKQKQKVLKKIPEKVIANAKGLAIFTTMRTGLWVSGAGGSGVLIARKEDGTWSPPSGILLHTAGLGFLIGVDIYDCVIVINSQKALDGFTKLRATVGAEVSAVAGPVGIGGILDSEVHKRQAPVWTYLKSRGFYAGVQIDGTVIIERTDENERFYGYKIGVKDILAGKVRHPPYELKMLMETLKAAQGDGGVDQSVLPDGPSPSDMEVERSDAVFGIPDKEDPDPYGVHALEKEGLEIREAGTRSRPSSEQFEYRPSPTSPIFNTFTRRSLDSHNDSRKGSWRSSTMSMDRGTQTAVLDQEGHDQSESETILEHGQQETGVYDEPEDLHADTHEEVHEAAAAAVVPPVISRARLVTIQKRSPPPLPPRAPGRGGGPLVINADPVINGSHGPAERGTGTHSPADDGFDEVSLTGSDNAHKGGLENGVRTEEKSSFGLGLTMRDNEAIDNMGSASSLQDSAHTLRRDDSEKVDGEEDNFHSIPTTPLESPAPGKVEESREDFS
ncbi:MAG: hypothetical protein M1827_004480 [Pycnora praestabilis]|nr:MAG: hypothetical protein M1827_004480 [Pycnora praestabilis]